VYQIRYTICCMAGLQPINAVHINDQVYEAIETAIVRCELGPGELLGDRQLAEALGVSRTPVRDALHRLESSGLVERRGRAGWAVSAFALRDVHELFELRRILEPLGLERLAQTWEEGTVEELSRFFEDFPDRMPEDLMRRYLCTDRRFHKRIVECSENGRIVRFYEVVEKQIDRVRHYVSYNYEGRVGDSLAEHREICAAISARDLSAATEALVRHLHKVEELIAALAQELGVEGLADDGSARVRRTAARGEGERGHVSR
jgi:DNA-binding GntR family transcriptional regulator